MSIKKWIFSLLVIAVGYASGYAQNGASSPVSRYGFGQLTDKVIGRSTAMGGASLGLRAGAEVNVANPASYSAVDSLTFLWDAGVSVENVNYNNGTLQKNFKSASFDYIAMQFRAFSKVGMAFGFIPYSKVGYSFGDSGTAITDIYGKTTPATTFEGTGGLSQGFLGIGWNPIAGLSIGANFMYTWGDIEHTITNSYSESSVYSNIRLYSARISTVGMNFGLQYALPISKVDRIVLGATYEPGHDVNNYAYRQVYLYDTYNEATEGSTTDSIKNAFQMPASYGIGLSYSHGRQLTVAADFILQKWGNVKYPMTYTDETGANVFGSRVGFLQDRKKVSLGIEFTPNSMSRNYLKRVHYRLGGYYSNQYAKIDKYKAGKEFGLSAGFGLPIQNQWNTRSSVNLAAQWIHVSPGASNLIVENYFRITVGITFDERWFMKFKFE